MHSSKVFSSFTSITAFSAVALAKLKAGAVVEVKGNAAERLRREKRRRAKRNIAFGVQQESNFLELENAGCGKLSGRMAEIGRAHV